jgi:hypothetical protein
VSRFCFDYAKSDVPCFCFVEDITFQPACFAFLGCTKFQVACVRFLKYTDFQIHWSAFFKDNCFQMLRLIFLSALNFSGPIFVSWRALIFNCFASVARNVRNLNCLPYFFLLGIHLCHVYFF